MAVDEKTVSKIAHLARLKIEADQIKSLQKDMSQILDWVDTLKELDTDDVEPMSSPVEFFVKSLPEREDKVTDGGCVQKIVSNAPESTHNMFVVPKVIE
ncbi:MAG: Asp-tRNA(Asn)/Glu-tRNA(Gln) amidotransferase subunit GatC [Alphaproteobacteria bacterium]|jgi:aspartyl-tRNA(Asn)/glutamyl-tRNA(Gln) amidotransferase subunit C|nr:Asp-tRNA(Asn)/Glu-tRNA(Gln) amidotransferase subunit GatC [Alphaproteobacteria bacterium]MBT5390304.1 Asp-tRNA(Asn)/Glu-tRNA(Gln) amidotransferase subunit GatC [Alphaproteobacteria bacterium]MBT5540296.1 Asp-tRNA(Asn)/Glu-tRNA(Gln) amidotransferase subunit GatC [Alphaproteobacteria bacterium]